MSARTRGRSADRIDPRSSAAATNPPDSVLREAARVTGLARRLSLRSRREAAGLLSGAWRATCCGDGIEFDESRPFEPGDEVRSIDWNATARSGVLFVKRFRQERDRTLLLLVDVSASMGFVTATGTKSELAARAAALLCAAATHAGDRVGLVLFDRAVRDVLAPARGPAHALRVLRALLAARDACGGGTDLGVALARARPHAFGRRRGLVVLLSDWRDPASLSPGSPGFAVLAATAARHDLVSVVLHDPREDVLPNAGRLRVRDPEAPHRTVVVNSSDPRLRERLHLAAAARKRALERRLRGAGADVCWLRTDRDPAHVLRGFFARRAPGFRTPGHPAGAGP